MPIATVSNPLAATFDVSTVQTVSVIIIGVLVLLAVAALFIVRKIVSKVITIALVLALAVAVYIERDNLAECPKTCACSFFGLKLKIPDDSLAQKCKSAVSLGPIELQSLSAASERA
ncbi:hypothetical protein CLV47_12640 [Antricoccus suffuscus]|uniref:Uncharacterized protein n=1 Tax=Antricoccus suffuscus TaxID=1629062 RepID=A0A2T0Z8V0_9ACTN|nr:hypothetical protein [Antricoccus suffuscus]PRZ32766.1 hypothetical protein CLV47_12640 [Antricoccus suffuscus]